MIFRDSAKKENRGKPSIQSVTDSISQLMEYVQKNSQLKSNVGFLISSIFWEMLESNLQYFPKNTGNSFHACLNEFLAFFGKYWNLSYSISQKMLEIKN